MFPCRVHFLAGVVGRRKGRRSSVLLSALDEHVEFLRNVPNSLAVLESAGSVLLVTSVRPSSMVTYRKLHFQPYDCGICSA